MDELGKWEILIILAYMIMQVVGWIWLAIDTVSSLIECKKCVRRKNCEFLIFSEYCPKRYCMSEEEREELREKIKELD
jgi:hypothetical protein